MIFLMIKLILSFYAAWIIISLAIALLGGLLGLGGRAVDKVTSTSYSNDDRWNFRPEDHGMARYEKK